MNITDVRVKLASEREERLKAYCTLTIDHDFVVRDVKVIESPNGLFVAMPSRKLSDHCPKCRSKNPLRAKYCSDCGYRLPADRMRRAAEGRSKLHADVAHPINSEARAKLQEVVLAAYQGEAERAGEAGYEPPEEVAERPEEAEEEDFASLVASLRERREVEPGDEVEAEQEETGSSVVEDTSDDEEAEEAEETEDQGKQDSFAEGIF